MYRIKPFALTLLLAFALLPYGIGKAENSDKPAGDNHLPTYQETIDKSTGLIIWNEPELQPKTNPTQSTILDIPANDNCADATPIGETEGVLFSTVEATPDGPNDFVTNPNVWFLYTATVTAPVQIVVSDTTGSDYSISENCAIYKGAACPEAVVFPEPTQMQGGETIETATSISSLPAVVTGTIRGYSRDYEFSSCIYYGQGVFSDVVYSYASQVDDFINVLLDFESSTTTDFIVITDAEGNELACAREQWEQSRILNFPVTAGETYYFVIGNSWGTDIGDPYTLKISSPNYILAECLDASYYVNRTTMNVVVGEQYLIEIGAHHSSSSPNCEGYLSIIPNPIVPINDDCEDATQMGILQPGSVLQATGDNRGAPSIDCHQSNNAPEVWVTFAIEDTMDISIDLCGTPVTFHSSFLYLTEECPCDLTYSRISSSNYTHISRCISAQLIIYFTNVPPGSYYFPICSQYGAEGEYIINVKSLMPQVCDDEALFGQKPITNLNNSCFIPSDIQSSTAISDDFGGLDEAISQITWWGDDYVVDADCDSDSLPFQITFCNDVNDSPGDTIAIYDVDASIVETGYIYVRDQYYQKKFTATLSPPLSVSDGWVIIRGNSENGCIFTWQMNNSSNGFSKSYNESSGRWITSSTDFAFCLSKGPVDIDDEPADLPLALELQQNYPNPFNATTSIQFSLETTDHVNLSVYDVGGRRIKTLHDGVLSAGTHSIIWDGANEAGEVVSSGIYFYRLKSSEGSFAKRMVLLK